MKLEIGHYFRTNDGMIYKNYGGGTNFFGDTVIYVNGENNLYDSVINVDVKKSSFNLIDLIEVGDVLTINQFNNDYEKVEVYETFNIYTKEKELCVLANGKPKRVIEVNIKSVLTHEQYEANCYKVGE